jgi:subtilisin family serine protease
MAPRPAHGNEGNKDNDRPVTNTSMEIKMAKGKRKEPGFVPEDVEAPDVKDYVIAELRYDSNIAIEPAGRFGAPAKAAKHADKLNALLAGFDLERVVPHFAMPSKALAARATAVPMAKAKVSADYAQSGFVQIVPKNRKDAARLAAQLSKSTAVWSAHVAPRPVPAAAASGSSVNSRNFEPAQGYLHSAPNGISAIEAWATKGAKGKGVTICDIEGNWNTAHEDLPPGIPLLGGTLIATQGWRDHGTAVLGEMVSRPNAFGTVGIVPEANAATHSAVINGVFNTAGAISGAAARLKAGDVILIELQATGPNNKYVAMQYWDDVFSAIRAATAKGITVVEAAGNGDENFDLPIFNGTGLQKDSGAIVVGAGIPPTNYFDFFNAYANIGVPRSRIWFSNYGKIVSVHGWGWHVTTCGYGDAQGGVENRWYTHRFSGTSSASPIVTGAAAALQGVAKAKLGTPLTPAKVRKILMTTGTPQVAGPGVPVSQRIGPLPNLAKAVKKV